MRTIGLGMLLFCMASMAAFADGAQSTPIEQSDAVLYQPGLPKPPVLPIAITPGPYLFIDDALIASSDGVQRVLMPPVRDEAIPNPVVTGKEDGCFQPYMTVLRDEASGRFRMWHSHRTEDMNAGAQHMAYMESGDGIHWERPTRVLADPGPMQFGVSVVDLGERCTDPARRYACAWWKDGGLRIGISPDGWTWKPVADSVLIPHNHDITGLYFDAVRGHYAATLSVYRGGPWKGDRRVTMQSFSHDLLSWTPPRYVVLPDQAVDAGETQFYAMDGYLARGHMLIGMVKVLRDDLKADNPPDPPDAYGMGYTALAWSHDGKTWFRDSGHFFDPDPRAGAWDHAHAWIDEQVLVDGQVYLYYGGYAHGHKVNRFEERQIGLVRIPRDRYVAREAGGAAGVLITPPLVLTTAQGMRINAEAGRGAVTVEVRGTDTDMALPGFGFDDMRPVVEDALDAPVTWKGALDTLNGKPIRLAFRIQNARLYGFTIEQSSH